MQAKGKTARTGHRRATGSAWGRIRQYAARALTIDVPFFRAAVAAPCTLCVLGLALSGCAQWPGAFSAPPDGPEPVLVALSSVAPQIEQDMRYFGERNFMGRRVAGYEAARCWLSRPAAQSLRGVQAELQGLGLRLKVYDCYRPQAAVDDFVRWGRDAADQKTKSAYYPRVPKSELFQRGYIAERSGHSRASTVDLTVVVADGKRARDVLRGPLADGQEVDMGTPFDLFDEKSHTNATMHSPDVQHNRHWLRALMERHGWRNLPEEWWHFTLRDEPFPDRYFQQPVR